MDDRNRIPMPSPMERKASIQQILDKQFTPARPSWWSLPLSVLVFGVEDSLFLSVLVSLLPLGFAFLPQDHLSELLPAVLFLSSPLLYAAAHILSMWKESLTGTLDWKRTCRLPLNILLVLRMGLFGGAAVTVCVPVNLLLWQISGQIMPVSRALAYSFSSLFLYAAASLALWKVPWGAAVPTGLWAVMGISMLYDPHIMDLLLEVPTAVFFLLAGAGLVYCLCMLRAMLCRSNKGGTTYALR